MKVTKSVTKNEIEKVCDSDKCAMLHCKRSGNPCGTDTWAVGHTCPCDACRAYLALFQPLPPGTVAVLSATEIDAALAAGRLDRLREEDALRGTQSAPAFERSVQSKIICWP